MVNKIAVKNLRSVLFTAYNKGILVQEALKCKLIKERGSLLAAFTYT